MHGKTGRIAYFPFGLCRISQGNLAIDRQFTGQILDSTGLYYYNARYYDPTIGRFISPDTVVQSYSNPQTLNRYSYCSNNPLNHTDPTGLDYISDHGGGTQSKITKNIVVTVVVTTYNYSTDACTIDNGAKLPGYKDNSAPSVENLDEGNNEDKNILGGEILPYSMDGSTAIVGAGVLIGMADEYMYDFGPMAPGSIPVSKTTMTFTASLNYSTNSGYMVANLSIVTGTADFNFKPTLSVDNGKPQYMTQVQRSTPSYSALGSSSYQTVVTGGTSFSNISSLSINLNMLYNNPYHLTPALTNPGNFKIPLK